MKLKLFFAWFDFWIGFYWDRKERELYIAPFPCFVIKVAGLFQSRELQCAECGHSAKLHVGANGCLWAGQSADQTTTLCICTWRVKTAIKEGVSNGA